jgi:hypothetical protein
VPIAAAIQSSIHCSDSLADASAENEQLLQVAVFSKTYEIGGGGSGSADK